MHSADYHTKSQKKKSGAWRLTQISADETLLRKDTRNLGVSMLADVA